MLLGIQWRSLRLKIIAWSFVPTAIILVAVALVGFVAYQQVTESLVFERNRELARRIAGQLASELGAYTRELTALARTEGLYGGNALLQRVSLKLASNRLAMFDAGAIILDSHGTVAATEPERSEIYGQDWSNRAYFRQMVHSPAPVFSDILSDGPGQAKVIVVAVPITGPRGEFVGTLAGMFRLGETNISSFYATIVKLRIGANDPAYQGAYLVDQNGLVIYHTDNDRVGDDFSSQPAVKQVLAGQSNALRTRDLTGQQIIASFAPVPGTPWSLVTEISWNALMSASQNYRSFLLLLLGLGVIIPAIVVAIGVGRITKPIVELTKAARQVAEGDLGQMVTASTGDELEDLAQQFNRMSAELAESYTQLRERQARLEFVMERTNDGIWDWDLGTNEVYFSPRWKSILGYQDHELSSQFAEWQTRIHPEDADRATATIQAYLRGETPIYQLEHRLRHKDGSYRWILARGIALRDADGKPQRLTGSHTDITERKLAEEEIYRQNTYLAALHETSLAVVGRLDVTELLEAIVERTINLIGANYGWVYLVTPEKDAVEVRVGTGLFRQYIGTRLKPGEGLAGQVWQTGEPAAVEDYHSWLGRSPRYEKDLIGPAVGVPLKSGTEVIGVTGLTRAPLQPPFRQDEIDMMERLAQLASIALENARLHTSLQTAYQTLEQRVEERTHELATVNAIAAVVSRSLDLKEIMRDALEKMMEIIGMEHGIAYRLEGEEGDSTQTAHLRVIATCGFSAEFTHFGDGLPVRESAAGVAGRQGEPMIWSLVDLPTPNSLKQMLAREGVRQVISIPLMAKGRFIGALNLSTNRVRSFAPEQIELLKTIGQQVGVAVENARLYEQAERSAQVAERNRLARELHDSVTQSLYSVTLYAEAAARLLSAGKNIEASEHLRDLRDTAQEALREMRLLIFELRPPALEKSGLVAALQARLEAVEGRGGMLTELDVVGAPKADQVPLVIQEQLFQIAREALNNVLKHAHAQHVRVQVQFKDSGAHLQVSDDGVGFDVVQVRDRGGLGLRGIQERAQKLGADLRIESTPGQGTTVRITVENVIEL